MLPSPVSTPPEGWRFAVVRAVDPEEPDEFDEFDEFDAASLPTSDVMNVVTLLPASMSEPAPSRVIAAEVCGCVMTA